MTTATIRPTDETCWQAVADSDRRYDGHFVTAVKTTKIYCRPSCPARLPKRQNVEFFALPIQAEDAGYRACKRCHPREVDVQDEGAARVQAICDYIRAHHHETITLENLGETFYVSPTHLQRSFKKYMGISPRQYMDSCRMNAFKSALQSGESVTNATYQAGYGAGSRMYEQWSKTPGLSPSDYQRKGANMTIQYTVAPCNLGYILVAATEKGVCSLSMGDDIETLVTKLHNNFAKAAIERNDDAIGEALQQVLNYLEGQQPHFDLPLDIQVTAFQKRVLEELQRIPYGETRSYGEIAKALGKPKASRAVGAACGANPVPLIIPCHRVIGSSGKITGYAFGTDRKKQLLTMEKDNALHQQET
ncbi:MAG: bifunctional DNA-binding transcriptional regulator/O6-methylguanine-DNA methyltransferase Ada [Aggregatilineales bacterium]